MKTFWSEHRSDFFLAILFFITSSIFFEVAAKLSSLEYGVPNISLEESCKLDCHWYSSIVRDGYHLEPSAHPKGDAANWAFFPTFPIAAKFLAFLTGYDARVVLPVTSRLFLLASIFLFLIVAKREFGENARVLSGMLVAFNPYVVYAYAGYTETLYFFLTALAFHAADKQRWVSAGFFSAILSSTRLVGVFFGAVLAMEYFRTGVLRNRKLWPALMLGLMLCPLGLAAIWSICISRSVTH